MLTDAVIESLEKLTKINVENTTEYFFKTLVDDILPNANEDIRFHLTRNILSRFTHIDELKKESFDLKDLYFGKHEDQVIYLSRCMQTGDMCLFLTGIYPEKIENSKTPFDMQSYYEAKGSEGYAQASRHQMAKNIGVEKRLEELARNFTYYRMKLNDLSENYIPISKEVMGNMMIEEEQKYKQTGDKEYLDSAKKRAELLNVLPSQYPSLFEH